MILHNQNRKIIFKNCFWKQLVKHFYFYKTQKHIVNLIYIILIKFNSNFIKNK